jgi:hypothetical protein
MMARLRNIDFALEVAVMVGAGVRTSRALDQEKEYDAA